MKRDTKLKIIASVVALGLSTSYVDLDKKINDTFDMYLPIKDAITDIYGDQVEVDEQFVKAYIKTIEDANKENNHRMSRIYNPDSVLVTNNEAWEFFEWIPTLEEVQDNISKVKTFRRN